ncbi:MAG TPA: S-methyl-5'-thioinosine phosphorylase [Candidatus Nanopelagicaceae bacterium]|jgi:5'-deoxy-5'-methylthioadenosine phosphorylase|nr:S-methyl-5'-thioinosine phosphorylase [Candidatus Nanopelagicaceae bacterium]
MPKIIGLIAGTGFYDLPALKDGESRELDTLYGKAQIRSGEWNGARLIFLTRHGVGHSIPPHLINYRANIKAMKDLGVEQIIAINVVGGINPKLSPGDLCLVDDFIDFTSGRQHTFSDGSKPGVQHVDLTRPYDAKIQSALRQSAKESGILLHENGVYAGFNGPRFETPSEIRLAALAGATVVGMTGCPEVSLARELGIAYASIALVVNPAAGLSEAEITMDEINKALDLGKSKALTVIEGALKVLA